MRAPKPGQYCWQCKMVTTCEQRSCYLYPLKSHFMCRKTKPHSLYCNYSLAQPFWWIAYQAFANKCYYFFFLRHCTFRVVSCLFGLEKRMGAGALALLWHVEEAEKLQSSLSFFKPLRFIYLFILIFLLRPDILYRQTQRSSAYFGLHPRKTKWNI